MLQFSNCGVTGRGPCVGLTSASANHMVGAFVHIFVSQPFRPLDYGLIKTSNLLLLEARTHCINTTRLDISRWTQHLLQRHPPTTAPSFPPPATPTSASPCNSPISPPLPKTHKNPLTTNSPQLHPPRHPILLPPPTLPHHIPAFLRRSIPLLYPARHHLRHRCFRKYPHLVSQSQESGLLPRAEQIRLRGGGVGDCADWGSVGLFYCHVSPCINVDEDVNFPTSKG